jgi:hypothetical protein
MAIKGTASIYNRIAKCHMKALVEKLKNDIRLRFRSTGKAALYNNEFAHNEVWPLIEPVVLAIEAEREAAKAKLEEAKAEAAKAKEPKKPTFVPHQGDVSELLDPNYDELDEARQARDAFLWAGLEFRLVCRDEKNKTVMDFSKAKTPPPNAMAVQIAEYYGEHKSKRENLLARMAQFAAKPVVKKTVSSEPESEETEDGHADDDVFGELGID